MKQTVLTLWSCRLSALRVAMWLLLVTATITSSASAQVDVVPRARRPAIEGPLQDVDSQIEQLTDRLAKEDVDESARAAMAGQLDELRQDLARIEELRQKNVELQAKIDTLTATAEELREEPADEQLEASALDEMSAGELEAAVAALRVQRSAEEQELSGFQNDVDKAAEQKTTLQEQLLVLEQQVVDATEAIEELSDDSTSLQALIEHRRAEIQQVKAVQLRDLARSRLANLAAEMSLNIPAMRVSRQQKLIALHEARLKTLQARLEEKRQRESEAELSKAQNREPALAAIENEQVRQIGQEQLDLAKESYGFTQQIPRWEKILEQRKDELTALRRDRDKIRKQVTQFGADATIGRALLHFETRLPSIDEVLAQRAKIDQLTADLQIRYLEYQAHAQRAQKLAADLGDAVGTAEEEILASSPILVTNVTNNSNKLYQVLSDVYGTDLETIAFVNDWTEYAQEHALWLRSHDRLSQDDVQQTIPELQKGGRQLLQSLRSDPSLGTWSFWTFCLPAVLSVVLLVSLQSQAKQRLIEQGELATARSCISMRPTCWALLLSFGMAAEWPLLFMFIGTVLSNHRHSSVIALGEATVELGAVALWLNFLRQVLRSDGLASHHLDWYPTISTHLRRWLRLVLVVLAVPMFLFLLAYETPTETDSVERILFLLLQICSIGLLLRLLFPPRGTFVSAVANSWWVLDSTRYVWTTGLVLVPLLLAICSAAGFHHTAIEIWIRLGWTVVMITGVILFWSLILRWLSITHRAMRLTLARERAQKRDDTGESGETAEQSMAQLAPNDESDFLFYGKQARQLAKNVAVLAIIGCTWGIWFDVLPALRGLDRQDLWAIHDTVLVQETDADGVTMEKERSIRRPVTIVSLLLVVFVGAATFVGVRQLPGLIEVILIRRTKLDSGVRYTITTVFRYAMLIAGTTMVSHLLGLRWSQVQWLVAGLSVGLGFGLQEVFANFVSGIIILMERPIRIGDVVTIDGVSGVVSRIQIRATSITDWDRREYIVPNRELVTGKLLNWTLSDSTNRIVINVGIGYSNDPDLARETMLRIAKEHPNVMDDPGPIATFESFGNSSLDLVLRAYLPDMDNRLGTITEIHTQILRAFDEAGINIPFPQREVKMLD